MRRFIVVAIVAALSACFVPQAAFGLEKPPVTTHSDIAPIETPAAPAVPDGKVKKATTSLQAMSLDLSGTSGGTNAISFASLTTGDIIVVLDPTSLTGHAGLFDRTRYSSILSYAVLSANVSPFNGVQIEKCVKYRLYERAYGLRVPQEYAHRVAVRDFALRQLGKPYSVLASKTDLSSFYCSKLPWAAYRYVAGVDLDADGGIWVWPVDLLNSRYTSIVGYWS
jgi:cell wall-associated NlpC family hydrolase